MLGTFKPLEMYHFKEKRILASKVVDCSSVKYDGEFVGGYIFIILSFYTKIAA